MAIPACSVRMSLTGAALAVAALAVAGCGPSSSGSSPSAPAAPASSAVGGASAPGGTAAPSPSSGSGGSGSGSAAPACTTGHLSASAVDGEGAAGTDYTTIDFTNTGSTSCTLYGFPGVSLANSGGPIGASATRIRTGSPSLVTLAPGAKANTVLGVANAENFPSDKCSPDAATFLLVYPPNQTEALDMPFKSTGCKNSAVKLLTIKPMAPGALGANP